MKAIRSPERFLEETAVPCILIRASFDLDSDGHRFVQMDFETPVHAEHSFFAQFEPAYRKRR